MTKYTNFPWSEKRYALRNVKRLRLNEALKAKGNGLGGGQKDPLYKTYKHSLCLRLIRTPLPALQGLSSISFRANFWAVVFAERPGIFF